MLSQGTSCGFAQSLYKMVKKKTTKTLHIHTMFRESMTGVLTVTSKSCCLLCCVT